MSFRECDPFLLVPWPARQFRRHRHEILFRIKPFVRNWVANHYVARIERAFRAEGVEPQSISIVIASAPAPVIGGGVLREASAPSASVSYLPPPGLAKEEDVGARGLWTRMLHPQQTFVTRDAPASK